MLGRFTAQFCRWERPAQIGFLMALALLLLALLVGMFGAETLRQPALIGFFGLLIVMQIIVMWANRGMVTDFTRAQRYFLNEDFEAARAVLEARRSAGKADWRELTLLGNTYRQLGQLEAGKMVLSEALNIRPEHHFPLYGFGRTLLSEGEYIEAARVIERALAAGAPPVVGVDLAEAWYRAGQPEAALAALDNAGGIDDPPRALMAAYLRQRLRGDPPPAPALLAAGLRYWQAAAARFAHTPYGQALQADLEAWLT